jgi:hypothetical protein
MLLLDDDDELPLLPDEAEAELAAQLGEERVRAIEEALVSHTRVRWLKVARVVADALKAGGFPATEDAFVRLHVRRVIALVDSGRLEAQGKLRRPRRSEVRLPMPGQPAGG